MIHIHILAILIVAVWGTTFVSTKHLIMAGLGVEEIFLIRFVIAYVCIWAYSIARGRSPHVWSRSVTDELLFVALGVTGGSLYFVTENMAIGQTHVSNVSFIVCTAPLLTVLIAKALNRSMRVGRRLAAGSVIALAGVGLVVFNGQYVLRLSPVGDLLALAAATCWATYSLIIRHVSGRYGAVFVTRKVFAYGIATILPFMAMGGGLNADLTILARPVVWGNLLFLSLVASFACFVLWSWCIQKIGVIATSNYVYLNPITTLVASAIALDEPMTWLSALGSALILGGVYMANKK